MDKGVLTFFCGKMGAGKTTKAREISQKRNAVLLSEDEWLASIYPNSIKSLEDYIKYSGRLWRTGLVWSCDVFWRWRVCLWLADAKYRRAYSCGHARRDRFLWSAWAGRWRHLRQIKRNLFFFFNPGFSDAVA